MPGTLHIIPAADRSLHRIIQLDGPPPIFQIEKAVGGSIHLIAGFDSILRFGELEPCFAFCNERACQIGLEQNTWANLLWLQARVRTHGFSEANISSPETLRGPIALLWGDAQFFSSLQYTKKLLHS